MSSSNNLKGSVILVLIVLVLFLSQVNFNSKLVQTLLGYFSTIGSAIIGGYVAFYVSRLQVESNKKLEYLREKKQERAMCLLVSSDLEDIINRIDSLLATKKDNEISISDIKRIIITTSLIRFKENFLYLMESEQDIKKVSSIVNRLVLFEEFEKEKVTKESIQKLLESCSQIYEIINILLNDINLYIEENN